MSHATPIMRNVTPTQRMSHGSPSHSMSQTPVMNQAMMGTPQVGGAMGLTPQQQQMLMQQRQQQLLAQQGHLGNGQFNPQHLAHMQANMHAQQNIQSQQQQHMLQQAQQNNQPQQSKIPNPQAYQAQMMRAQLAQMQAQNQQHPQGQQQNQGQQGSPQLTPQQQQQMMMAAAQANGGPTRNLQGINITARQQQLYQNRLMRLRQDMAQRLMPQYGPPNQYPPQIAQQYHVGLERSAKAWLMEGIFREQENAQQRASHAAAVQAQVMQQQQQQNMMHNGMK